MAFKIKDGVRIGTVDVFNNAGELLVNAPTATTAGKWTAARTITLGGDLTGNVSIDGSANVTLTATIAANSVALGTDTTGNYVATIGAGTSGTQTSSSGLTITAAAGEGTAATIAHADTSTQANLTATARTYVTGLTFDTYGHVTALTTGTETTTDTDTTYDISAVTANGGASIRLTAGGSGSGTDDVTFASGTNITVAYTDANTITISGSESDTLATVTARSATTATAISITNATASTTTTTGALVVTGGVGVGGAINVGGDAAIGGSLTVTGDLIVNGTTSTINSTTLSVDDKNIELGSVTSPSNATADGGGITLKGTTDKTFNWISATGAWTSSENLEVAAGKTLRVSGATSGTAIITAPAVAGSPTLTLPATTGTLALTSDIKNAALTLTASAGATNTAVTIGTGTGFTSNDDTATTYDIDVGPALTNLATIMTGAAVGVLKKTAQDTYVLDTTSYLTVETDTLQTVTTRGNTTNTAIVLREGTTDISAKQAFVESIATVTQTAADTWPAATFRSAKYLVQITQGTNYQVSELLVIHNGTTTYMTEYAVLETNGALATFASDISGGNVRLLATMASAAAAVIDIDRTAMYV